MGAIEWETKKSTSTFRQNVKCKCGEKRSRLVTQVTVRSFRSDQIGEVGHSVDRKLVDGRHESADKCVCGRDLFFRDVKGTTVADKICNAKCTNSIGFVCECSCGGKNHGSGFGGSAC